MNVNIPSHKDVFMINFLVHQGWTVNPSEEFDLYYPPVKEPRGFTLREAYEEAIRVKNESKRSKKGK